MPPCTNFPLNVVSLEKAKDVEIKITTKEIIFL
jgi:hypothetical protein